MRIFKSLLMLVLLVVVAGAGLTIASHYIPADKLRPITNITSRLQPAFDGGVKIASNLGVAQRISDIQGKVLGVQTAKTEAKPAENASSSSGAVASVSIKNDQSLPQKTFEFARYSYCQEVVKSYESEFVKNTQK